MLSTFYEFSKKDISTFFVFPFFWETKIMRNWLLLRLNPRAQGKHLISQLSWVTAWLLVTLFCPFYLVEERFFGVIYESLGRWWAWKGGRVVSWEGGKDGRAVRWQGKRFLVLFKSGGRRVCHRFHLFVSDVNQPNEGAGWLQDYLVRPQGWKDFH